MRKVFFTLIIIVIAGFAFVAGGKYGKDQASSINKKAEPQVLYYTDPMNPGFRSEKPGMAPCGMPLEPVYGEVGSEGEQVVLSSGPPQSIGAVKINPARQQLIGVQTNSVETAPMTYTLRLYGKVLPDDTRVFSVNTSTDSWVRTLSEATVGSIVNKDQLLAEVLDPDFYTAQVTYLVSLSNVERYRQKLGADTRFRQVDLADNQLRVAVQDLLDLGITDAQVEELAETKKAQPYLQLRSPVNGVILERNLSLHNWIKAGNEFYKIADLGRVWVYADVFEQEARFLMPGMKVKVIQADMGKTFTAQVGQVMPIFDPLSRTRKVRLDVDNPRYDLWPDMFVDVEIPITMPSSLHVPADAVVDSGTQKIVYVETGNSTFEPRPVEMGWRLGRQIEITKGLMPGEKVIVSGNFLVDSESRMKTAAGGVIQAMSKDPVCGMYVNEEYARLTGKAATYGDKTYYFCMDTCREEFEKEPEKYVEQKDSQDANKPHAALQTSEKSWLDKLESVKHGRTEADSGAPPSGGSSWGDFMNPKYLGLQPEPEKDLTGMKAEIPEPPAADQPADPAER
jgi:membrane fusion protein, copper/silver efflux system